MRRTELPCMRPPVLLAFHAGDRNAAMLLDPAERLCGNVADVLQRMGDGRQGGDVEGGGLDIFAADDRGTSVRGRRRQLRSARGGRTWPRRQMTAGDHGEAARRTCRSPGIRFVETEPRSSGDCTHSTSVCLLSRKRFRIVVSAFAFHVIRSPHVLLFFPEPLDVFSFLP